MAILGRLKCHFCGKRTQYSKGATTFQCTNCEAINFFDSKGNVEDTPASIAARSQQQKPEVSTRPLTSDLQHQNHQTFCTRCVNNQRMYMESLSNYLPDESHPKYKEFEDALPQYKASLEQRYPQVCKKCAAKAQEKLHKADYYGMAQSAAIQMDRTQKRNRSGRSPIGGRDNWRKRTMRFLLNVVGSIAYFSVLIQVMWHAYGILTSLFIAPAADEFDGTAFAFDPTPRQCVEQSLMLRFDSACFQVLSLFVQRSLIVSLCLLWYNHGMKKWYDPTYRMEYVSGQMEHFRMQLVMLVVRTAVWYTLSNPDTTSTLTKQQLIACHGFLIAFLLIGDWSSKRPIGWEIWKLRGKIVPKPSEKDVFGAFAGPADEDHHSKASSTNPMKLFERNDRPFPIENLAPRSRNPRGYSKLDSLSLHAPSPPQSMSDSEDGGDDDGDAMDIDWQPSRTAGMPGTPIDRTYRPKSQSARQPQMRSMYNHGTTQPAGWGAMRTELFDIEDKSRTEEEHKRQEQERKLRYDPPVEKSPFRGRLPQAPMSMERRLRNPPTQVQFKKQPLSKQQDFMQQMRQSFENGRFSVDQTAEKKHVTFKDMSVLDDDDFSPAKSRTKGQMEIAEGKWKLPGDFAQSTGLEELFAGKTFSIADEPTLNRITPVQRRSVVSWAWIFAVVAPVALVLIGWNVFPIRRAFLLWLVRSLEEFGWVPADIAGAHSVQSAFVENSTLD